MTELLEAIETTFTTIKSDISTVASADDVEQFRLKYLVKKGIVTGLTEQLRTVPKEEKPTVGKKLNELRRFAQEEFDKLKDELSTKQEEQAQVDVTLPGRRHNRGTMHPVRSTLDEMIRIFGTLGFGVAEGLHIESDYYNFEALNFPANHPARDMQDTFFVKTENPDDKHVLRTHTSPGQVRLLKNQQLPVRHIVPGRVYRNEDLDATHLAEFFQVEGLCVDKNISMADLKGTLVAFFRQMYGESIEFRFRPSFFPFTEPSGEFDIRRPLDDGTFTPWMEVCGR
jgi:phenylalanyl-tRNA synthetase alpha chain